MKVHAGGNEVHTGQLFFPDDLSDTVFQSGEYAARGSADTTNERDGIFAQSGGRSMLNPERRGDGYAAAMTVGVTRT
jgi:hypothetical protein